jgi:hypothetical protein
MFISIKNTHGFYYETNILDALFDINLKVN